MAMVYTIALAVMSLVSLDDVPDIQINNSDKILHIFAYALLTFIWFWSTRNYTTKYKNLIIIVFCIVYGIILEVIQGRLATDRVSDMLDIIANCIGVALATLLFLIKRRT